MESGCGIAYGKGIFQWKGVLIVVKNRVKIQIDGKSFTLMGPESEEHIRSVAMYIDKKMKEIRETAQMGGDRSLAYILTSLNVGNDYFKEVEHSLNLEARVEELELELLGKEAELEEMTKKVEELAEKKASEKENVQENHRKGKQSRT